MTCYNYSDNKYNVFSLIDRLAHNFLKNEDATDQSLQDVVLRTLKGISEVLVPWGPCGSAMKFNSHLNNKIFVVPQEHLQVYHHDHH